VHSFPVIQALDAIIISISVLKGAHVSFFSYILTHIGVHILETSATVLSLVGYLDFLSVL
jgi:hypothetical protein